MAAQKTFFVRSPPDVLSSPRDNIRGLLVPFFPLSNPFFFSFSSVDSPSGPSILTLSKTRTGFIHGEEEEQSSATEGEKRKKEAGDPFSDALGGFGSLIP